MLEIQDVLSQLSELFVVYHTAVSGVNNIFAVIRLTFVGHPPSLAIQVIYSSARKIFLCGDMMNRVVALLSPFLRHVQYKNARAPHSTPRSHYMSHCVATDPIRCQSRVLPCLRVYPSDFPLGVVTALTTMYLGHASFLRLYDTYIFHGFRRSLLATTSEWEKLSRAGMKA